MKLEKNDQIISIGLKKRKLYGMCIIQGSMQATGANILQTIYYKELGAYKIFGRPRGRDYFWTFCSRSYDWAMAIGQEAAATIIITAFITSLQPWRLWAVNTDVSWSMFLTNHNWKNKDFISFPPSKSHISAFYWQNLNYIQNYSCKGVWKL